MAGEFVFTTDRVERQFCTEAVVDCIDLDEEKGVIQAHQDQERPIRRLTS